MEAPIYDAVIEYYDDGVNCISLVSSPAVESNFIAFSKEPQQQKVLFSANEEKQMITGVLLRANYPILRIDEIGEEFYIRFSSEVIRATAEKLLKDNYHNHINLEHIEGSEVDGVELQEIFIKDTEKGISPTGFENISDGSLFATYKVNNSKVWDSIKDGTFKGFSIEGTFVLNIEKKDTEYDEIMEMLNKLEKIKNRNK